MHPANEQWRLIEDFPNYEVSNRGQATDRTTVVAAVILRAVIRAKESGDIIMDSDPWRFIELLAADYLAGATA